jgi:exopolysaccharide biosynthesis polyprenyl glycosylphosphotransferase
MHMNRSAVRVTTLVLVDVATLLLVGLAQRLLFKASPAAHTGGAVAQFVVAVVFGLALFGCYGPGDQRRDPGAIARGVGLGAGVALWVSIWSAPLAAVTSLVAIWAVTTLLLLIARCSVNKLVRFASPGRAQVARAVVIGSADQAVQQIDHPAFGETPWCNLAAFFDPRDRSDPDTSADLARLIRTQRIDTVIIVGHLATSTFAVVLDAAITSGCQVLSFPRVAPTQNVSPRLVWRDGAPVIEFTRPGAVAAKLIFKRALDILASAAALIVLAPLFAIVATLIRAQSDGPVLFRQTRIGRGGRRFRIIKFRTMTQGAEDQRGALQDQSVYGDARHFKIASDPRVTQLGGVLRRSCIDELPQLWNVLIGDMSLVGPRPPLPSEVALYRAKDYARFDVKPGLTGPWQVSGRQRMCDFEEIVRLETAYIRRWSIWLDLELLLRTVPVVLSRRGAH